MDIESVEHPLITPVLLPIRTLSFYYFYTITVGVYRDELQ